MAKKKWYAKLATLFSNSPTTNHATSRTTTRTTTRSTPRTTNHTTSRTTTRTTTRSTPRTTNRATSRTTTRSTPRTTNRTTSRTTTRSTPRTTNRTTSRTTTQSTPRTTNRMISRTPTRTTSLSTSKSVQRPSGNHGSAASRKKYSLNKLKPKASILFKEDFKCIFCFQLPKQEEKRGIVICPNCRYPAHVDEFKVWVKASTLCSRCDTQISINFIRKPEIIPARVYLKAMTVLMKK